MPKEMTIEATADGIVFSQPHGEWRFKIDGKNNAMEVPGGTTPKSESKAVFDRQ